MSLKHGLLGILNYTPMTGYELDKAFKDSLSFFWQASTSQVYRELNTMESNGWLESDIVIQEDRPNKRVYSTTEQGKNEFNKWMSQPNPDIEKALSVKSAFLMRMFFAGDMNKKDALEMLKKYRQECIDKIQGMGAAHNAILEYADLVNNDQRVDFWKITSMFGDEFYRAGMIWADKAIALLEEKEQ